MPNKLTGAKRQMPSAKQTKSLDTTDKTESKLDIYINTFVRKEMQKSLSDYLSGIERPHEKKDGINTPIRCDLKRVVNITLYYRGLKKVNRTEINKLTNDRNNNIQLTEDQQNLGHYQSIIYQKARSAYLNHFMSLKKIESYCIEHKYDESVCLFAQMQYLLVLQVPDSRGRLIPFASNKGSLKIIDYLALCVKREDSPRYKEKFIKHRERKLKAEISKVKAD
jgi:hypothetical protein